MITIIEDNILNATILIVDDNPSNILLLQRLLTISGYKNIKSTTKSIEVLELYSTYQPDLLLLDLRMPSPDGFEIIEQLNRVKGDDYLPVIIITAQNDQECRLKALKIGAKDFIAKPFEHAEILMRIKNMLEMRLLHKEVREHKQRLEDKVQKRKKKLQDLQVELIHRLGRAAEFRDHGTWSHIRRICMYTFELGKSIGLPDEECQLLLYASTMHDIGKIGIPDEILFKAGPLNPKEWEIMKTHSVYGANILSGSSFEMLQMAKTIALTHHEKWDGTGYPQGLKGENIPLVGRITAICDVFDALVSNRPYKYVWPLENAIEEIKRGKGTHFDPNLVEAFLNIMPRILEIKEQYT